LSLKVADFDLYDGLPAPPSSVGERQVLLEVYIIEFGKAIIFGLGSLTYAQPDQPPSITG
jgi:hypothetical protein